ncbi:MAG: peptidase dimerization domain-containing protein, partial [Chloroflexota bacterium]
IISKLHDANNHIAVPGFYDDVVLLKDDERAELAKLDMTESKLKQESGVPGGWGETGFSLLERNVARPTMEINGLLSGWTGEGAKTVLPAKAMAKISCRLVANQNPQKIYEAVKAYVAAVTPPTVFSEVKLITAAFPAMVEIDTPEMQAAGRAYEQDWGAAPVFVRAGGTLPVVADLKGELDLSSILMNYGLPNDGAHGPDERYSLELFHRGIKTAIGFLEELSKR